MPASKPGASDRGKTISGLQDRGRNPQTLPMVCDILGSKVTASSRGVLLSVRGKVELPRQSD